MIPGVTRAQSEKAAQIPTGARVSVMAYGGPLPGAYVSPDGPECIGGGRMALVRLDRSPDVVTMVAAQQVSVS